MLDELESVDQAHAIFHGASPNLLLVSEMDGENFPVFIEYVNKLMKLLMTLGGLDIVLFSKATEIDSAQFLMSAMKLKDKLPFLLVRVGQCDRLVGSISRSQSYDVWVATSTHRSRSEAASVYYKMVNLRVPGEAADGLLFPDPDIDYPMLIIQYGFSWEDELMKFVELDKSEATICPRVETSASCYLYYETDLGTARRLVEEFGKYPRFAVTMVKDFYTKHLKYFFSYVMAAFWDVGDLLGGKHSSAHIMHAKRIRLGLTKRAYECAQERMGAWLQDLGLELRDVQTGKQLSGTSAASMTQASTTPEGLGCASLCSSPTCRCIGNTWCFLRC